jgi:hypothetical protein
MHPSMPPYYQAQAAWGQQAAQAAHMAAPQQQLYNQPQGGQQNGASGEICSLWIGDLQYWMDENYLFGCFASTGEVFFSIFFLLFAFVLFYSDNNSQLEEKNFGKKVLLVRVIYVLMIFIVADYEPVFNLLAL